MSSFRETSPARPKPVGLPPAMMMAIIAVAAVAVTMSVAAIASWGLRIGASVASGGLVATLNLWAFAYVGRGVLGTGGGRRLWGLLGGLKLIVLLGGLYLLLSSGALSGIAVVAGYGALPIGAAIGSFLGPRAEDLPLDSDEGWRSPSASGRGSPADRGSV
jgi:hypothetical protein